MGKSEKGDVVRRARDGRFGKMGIGDEGVVMSCEDDTLVLNGHDFTYDADNYDLVRAAITLTRGQFYRDADGKKVGPMRLSATWPTSHPYYEQGHLSRWSASGVSHGSTRANLVEEWVDAPVAAQAQPAAWTITDAKAGDLVTPINWTGSYFTNGQAYTVTSDRKLVTNSGYAYGLYSVNHAKWRPFSIEAGRFYKTRDGRKVGPLTASGPLFGAPGYSTREWYDTGRVLTHREHEKDLVAEWVEPAAKVNVAETVDYQADEYGSGASQPVAQQPAAKFKVGDRVRCPTGTGDATVREVRSDGRYRVTWDGGDYGTIWWRDDAFDLIKPTQPTAIVALIENGKPKPNSRPYVHKTVESANTEAARLANVYKGKSFGVYVLTGEPVFVEKPTYKHAWQNEAANGNKIAAIKELRAVADVGLWAAKTAVEDWVSRQARAA